MDKLKKIEVIVEHILEEFPDTRGDDFRLIAEVYNYLYQDENTIDIKFYQLMIAHKYYNLPAFESITRGRRKVQARRKDLRPSKEIQDARLIEETKYYNYALDVSNSKLF